jgi:transposase
MRSWSWRCLSSNHRREGSELPHAGRNQCPAFLRRNCSARRDRSRSCTDLEVGCRQAACHRHLGEALDAVRKSEYARLQGRERRYIKGQKYTLLSRKANLTLEGKKALKTLLAANKRLNTAYVLKESFGQLWSYKREGWARRFFENCAQASSGSGSRLMRSLPR